MDTASPQSGTDRTEQATAGAAVHAPGISVEVVQELWTAANADACGLSQSEFGSILATVGSRHNYGLPTGAPAGPRQQFEFCRALRLPELALAHACALGREAAWQAFFDQYRSALTQAAIAIAGSATLGHDLADSLYSDLYGLKEFGGERRSPLASYSGRGSLMGWLRTTLAQRHVDHHRKTHRETPIDTLDAPSPQSAPSPLAPKLARVTNALQRTLAAQPAEDRFLLASYFLDRRTLLEIARTLHVHEATISRRLKRLTGDLRRQLLHNLQSGGLSKRAAEEALGVDPRDVEINLRKLLQTSESPPFPVQQVSVQQARSASPTTRPQSPA